MSGHKSVKLIIVFSIVAPLLGVLCLVWWAVPTTVDWLIKNHHPRGTALEARYIVEALEQHKQDTGSYPTTKEGVNIVFDRLEPREWRKPKELLDAWGNPFGYMSPGEHNAEYDLWSLGSDKRSGGKGDAADITNWDVNGIILISRPWEVQMNDIAADLAREVWWGGFIVVLLVAVVGFWIFMATRLKWSKPPSPQVQAKAQEILWERRNEFTMSFCLVLVVILVLVIVAVLLMTRVISAEAGVPILTAIVGWVMGKLGVTIRRTRNDPIKQKEEQQESLD